MLAGVMDNAAGRPLSRSRSKTLGAVHVDKAHKLTVDVDTPAGPPSPSPQGGTTPHDQLVEFFHEIDTDGRCSPLYM